MEKSEQTLVPEWLKGNGNGTSGFAIGGHQTTSTDSDDHGSVSHSRNRVSGSVNNHDSGRSSFSDRATSSYFRWGSGSNSHGQLRGHSSFGGRNSRYSEWDSWDKEKSNLNDFKRQEYADPLDNLFPPIRADKDLRRSQSLVTGRRDERLSGKLASELGNISKLSQKDNNGLLSGRSGTQFEREFPSLGTDERQINPDTRRVSSPGLGTAIQSLPVGSSTMIGGDGWTSALAEVPVIVGSNGPSGVSLQSIPPSTTSTASTTVGGLNMAETVAQGTPRGNTTSQLPTGNLRLDEVVLKPLVPSKTTPKSSALNPTEKFKGKIQQPHQVSSPQVANLSTSSGAGQSRVGKLQVLKLNRERNEVPPTKEIMSPPSRTSPSNNVNSERRVGPAVLEKRANPHAQSRNDFFNLVRKKSVAISSSTSSVVVDASANKNNEEEAVAALQKEIISIVDEELTKPNNDNDNAVKEEPMNAGKAEEESFENGKSPIGSSRPSSPDAIIHSEEEEVAFLRSLGWEESSDNTEEDQGLTEEEISTFYKYMDEYIKLRPSSQTCLRVRSKLLGSTCSQSSSPRSSQVDS